MWNRGFTGIGQGEAGLMANGKLSYRRMVSCISIQLARTRPSTGTMMTSTIIRRSSCQVKRTDPSDSSSHVFNEVLVSLTQFLFVSYLVIHTSHHFLWPRMLQPWVKSHSAPPNRATSHLQSCLALFAYVRCSRFCISCQCRPDDAGTH
jgi:hypothetical protein